MFENDTLYNYFKYIKKGGEKASNFIIVIKKWSCPQAFVLQIQWDGNMQTSQNLGYPAHQWLCHCGSVRLIED